MKITRSNRGGRRGSKRLDVAGLREALKDTRVWASLAIVMAPDGEAGAEHWELDLDETGAPVDILVEVLLVPSNVEVTARLGGFAGAAGVITVPDVGDECLVIFPDGQLDWMPTLVARMSTGTVPNPTGQGPAPGRTVIVNTQVVVHDGSGGAGPLVTRAEFMAHTHAAPTLSPGDQTYTTPNTGAPTASITGTQVLLAK